LPFNLKRLRNYLSTRNIGRLTIKKRRFALTPDDLRKRLKLKPGDHEAVLFLTRIQEHPTVIVCKPFCHT
ncbi:MAG: SAM-dependent methyltransferase, partial [bacterium]|nr:SAM-dependent methyltransferase [bacterium]